jgi:hypothetical protein
MSSVDILHVFVDKNVNDSQDDKWTPTRSRLKEGQIFGCDFLKKFTFSNVHISVPVEAQ